MDDTQFISQILARWEEALEQGRPLAAEELCADRPELLPEVKRQIDVLQALQPVLKTELSADLEPTEGAPVRPRAAPSAAAPLPTVPGYDIIGELGRGGMGVVYKARQVKLKRLVALKMILRGAEAEPEFCQRFRLEAEAVAALHHPNIVHIHEIGEHEGRLFFSLEFVAGGSLATRLAQAPVPIPEAARLTRTLARAMHAAHQRGIIHRDLKPANILLQVPGDVGQDSADRTMVLLADAEGGAAAAWAPKIVDFGLAKRLDGTSEHTQTGAIMGTPSYMAPEQASGESSLMAPAVDIHALGVILYEMLTGRVPFRGQNAFDTMDLVRLAEPVPPSQLQPAIPRDLETITLHCLQKQPSRRYASAAALADDLDRYLRGDAIQARPVTAWERGVKWARRRPREALLVAVVVLVSLLGFGLVAWKWQEALDSAAAESSARQEATGLVVKEASARRRAEQQEQEAKDQRAAAESARRATEQTLADMYTAAGLVAGQRGDPALALLWFAHAAQQARQDPQREHVNRVRVQTWEREVALPVQALYQPGSWVTHVAFHPGGRHLLTRDRQNAWRIWELVEERLLPWVAAKGALACAQWSPDGQRLALALPAGQTAIYSFPAGAMLQTVASPDNVTALAFSADGNLLAVAGTRVRVWDCRKRSFTTDLPHPGPVLALSFNTQGDRLVTACADGQARLYAQRQGATPWELVGNPVPHRPDVGAPLFLERSRGLLTVPNFETAAWWDSERGQAVRTVPFTNPHGVAQISCMALSPNGNHFLLGGYPGLQLWDVSTAKPASGFVALRNRVQSAAFHPDSQSFLTASGDRAAQRWSVPGAQPVGPPLRHQASASAAAYGPTGQVFATAQEDGLLRVWSVPQGHEGDRWLALESSYTSIKVSRDGDFVVPTAANKYFSSLMRGTRVYAAATGQPAGPYLDTGGLLLDADLSPDGQRVVTAASDFVQTARAADARPQKPSKPGGIAVWARETGNLLLGPLPMPSEPRFVAYSPSGRQIAALCVQGQAVVMDADRGTVVQQFQHPWDQALEFHRGLVYTSDSKRVATYGPDATVRVWDIATGKLCYPALRLGMYPKDAQFTRDDRWLATGAMDKTARVWDAADGRLAVTLPHPDWVFAVHFSPDGRHLLTACRDGMARIWEWQASRLTCPPLRHDDEVFAALFSPDGRWVLTGCNDRTARVWDCQSGKPIAPPLPLGGSVWSVQCTRDGRVALVAGATQGVRAFDLAQRTRADDRAFEKLLPWAELVSGHEVQAGDVNGLTTAAWLDRWNRLRQP